MLRRITIFLAIVAAWIATAAPAGGTPAGCAVPLAPIPLPPDSPLGLLPRPAEGDCGGIRPGGQLLNGCTMAWVFRDRGGDLYVSTAGHCTQPLERASAMDGGEFGTVALWHAQGLGEDFSLIRVDDDKRALVSPVMCRFGGPLAAAPRGGPGGVYHIYGWGIETASSDDGRAKRGAELLPPIGFLAWEGRISPGDSGSPVMSAGGLAMGIATHRLEVGPLETPAGPLRAGGGLGTTLARVVDVAAEAGIELELVTGGTPFLPAPGPGPTPGFPADSLTRTRSPL